MAVHLPAINMPSSTQSLLIEKPLYLSLNKVTVTGERMAVARDKVKGKGIRRTSR
jgi:hypothetical protein